MLTDLHSLTELYSGPRVTISIEDHEYRLPKALLCGQSPYFQAAFEGGFKEGEEQKMELTKDEDVVSPQSFQFLVQWLTLGRVVFGEIEPVEAISCTIEFVRIADMCGVTGMENLMAERLKDIILAPTPRPSGFDTPLNNTYYITSEHIKSAVSLPVGHPVRSIIASAAVKGFLLHEKHKIWTEAHENPDFAVDLLREVKVTLSSLEVYRNSAFVIDHIRGGRINLK